MPQRIVQIISSSFLPKELHLFANELHQLVELVGGQALGTIALCLGGVVVHLDCIRPSAPAATAAFARSGTIHAWPQAWLRVHNNGQVGHLVQHHHTGKVAEGVLRMLVSRGADAALAEDDVLVARPSADDARARHAVLITKRLFQPHRQGRA